MKDVIAVPVRTFRPLSEEAYDVLREAILGGRLQPGARIVEADIARQMATSRSPVREAVRKLEHEGLVEYVPRRGTIVVGLSRDDVADAYQLRAHLEAYGARLAATRASQEHLARLLIAARQKLCEFVGRVDTSVTVVARSINRWIPVVAGERVEPSAGAERHLVG